MYGHYITNYMVLILCFWEGIWLHIVIYIINIFIQFFIFSDSFFFFFLFPF